MTETRSIKERLQIVESMLPELERRAEGELALIAARGNGGRLAGSCNKRDALRQEAKDLRFQLRGHELASAFDDLRSLDAELNRALGVRDAAELFFHKLAENPVIQKWNAAGSVARAHGFGRSWVLFSDWFLSGKARYAGLPEAGSYFLDPSCPEALKFDLDGDRDIVRRYVQARADADRALTAWLDCADRRARLLQSHPELQDVAA
jgi:hypothetical protein